MANTYVFIEDYYPHGAPIFGIWDYKSKSYRLADGDLYTEFLLKKEFPRVHFFGDYTLNTILLRVFEQCQTY